MLVETVDKKMESRRDGRLHESILPSLRDFAFSVCDFYQHSTPNGARAL